MESFDGPGGPERLISKMRRIGGKILELVAQKSEKFLLIPFKNRETPSFKSHESELKSPAPDIDVSPARVLSDAYGVSTENSNDETIVRFED